MLGVAVMGKTCRAPVEQEGSPYPETEYWDGPSSNNLVVLCGFPAMGMFVTYMLLGWDHDIAGTPGSEHCHPRERGWGIRPSHSPKERKS